MRSPCLLHGLRVLCVATEGASFRVLDTFRRLGAETIAISTRSIPVGSVGKPTIDDHVALTVDRLTRLGGDLLARIVRTADVLFEQIAVDRARESELELDAFQRVNPGLVIVTFAESPPGGNDARCIQRSSHDADTAVLAVETALAALWHRDRRNGEGVRLKADIVSGLDQGARSGDRTEVDAERRRADSLSILRAVDYSDKEIEALVGARVLALGEGD